MTIFCHNYFYITINLKKIKYDNLQYDYFSNLQKYEYFKFYYFFKKGRFAKMPPPPTDFAKMPPLQKKNRHTSRFLSFAFVTETFFQIYLITQHFFFHQTSPRWRTFFAIKWKLHWYIALFFEKKKVLSVPPSEIYHFDIFLRFFFVSKIHY